MSKKKVALVVDVYDWAFYINAKVIKDKLKNEYDIDIIASKSEKYNDDLFLVLNDLKDYDYIHFFWRKILLQFLENDFRKKVIDANIDFDDYVEVYKNKISTGIYDHLFLDEDNIKDYSKIFHNFIRCYVVCSKKLYDIYSNINIYPKPFYILGDIYDNDLMKPYNLERFEKTNRPLVIGWVGNSDWNIKYEDFKGVNTILNPVIDELKNEGYDIEKNYADKKIKLRRNSEMPEYFSGIDLYVCVSSCEGTPRPLIEAMACGVPVISTDVGVAREALEDLQKEYIIGDRKNGENDENIKENLKRKIVYLYENREILLTLSRENIKNSYKFSVNAVHKKYRELFM